MNFKEAYEAMKAGKKCWIPEEHTYPLYLVANGYIGFDSGEVKGLGYELPPEIAASENWKIYEEKPKVQTAEEYEKSYDAQGISLSKMIIQAFKAGQKSERNVHAELVQKCQDYMIATFPVNLNLMWEALENLKKYYKETE